ncbi:hypothetical protein [Bifidobacterium margollesii]|uniref:hypothetical protein n=1 Tax=Bifidobacterium margollesii TaxID=2020964 RepID=UPI003C2F0643
MHGFLNGSLPVHDQSSFRHVEHASPDIPIIGSRHPSVSLAYASYPSSSSSPNTPGARPVYREYNRRSGNHNWTLNKAEHDMLVRLG